MCRAEDADAADTRGLSLGSALSHLTIQGQSTCADSRPHALRGVQGRPPQLAARGRRRFSDACDRHVSRCRIRRPPLAIYRHTIYKISYRDATALAAQCDLGGGEEAPSGSPFEARLRVRRASVGKGLAAKGLDRRKSNNNNCAGRERWSTHRGGRER